jgi:hypothetical protein
MAREEAEGMAGQPRLFVGSSHEQLLVAREVQKQMEHDDFEVVIWDQYVLASGDVLWNKVFGLPYEFDFAVLVFNADDIREMNGVVSRVVRDNVLLEYGLFACALGPSRTFLLFDEKKEPILPTDCAGVTPLKYRSRPGQQLPQVIAPRCHDLRETIKALGPRTPSEKRNPHKGERVDFLSRSWVTSRPIVRKRVRYREQYVFEVKGERVGGTMTCWDAYRESNAPNGGWRTEKQSEYAIEGSFINGVIAAQYRSIDGKGTVGAFVFRHNSDELIGGCTYLSSPGLLTRNDRYTLIPGDDPPGALPVIVVRDL